MKKEFNNKNIKTLKFRPELAELILQGKKTTTWRMFDDKNLCEGDVLDLLDWETKQLFAKAKVTGVWEKPLRRLSDEEKAGHEEFANDDEMLKTYQKYYGDNVTFETIVKNIKFETYDGK